MCVGSFDHLDNCKSFVHVKIYNCLNDLKNQHTSTKDIQLSKWFKEPTHIYKRYTIV
jgi:hypothetical protein